MSYYKAIHRLNYRTGPGVKYQKVGILQPGAIVKVAALKGKWAKFESNKKYYYCAYKYLKSVHNYGDTVAEQVLPLAKEVVKNKASHVSGSYDYKGPKVNCSVFVSAVLQKAGVLSKGVTVYHTSKNHKKNSIGNCVHNRLKVEHYTWHKTNHIYKNLSSTYKKPGCIYVYASSMAIVGKDKLIYGCHSSGHKYTRLSMIRHKKNTYEYTSPILVVGVPNKE